jgi:D-beta-D-heptose 7-phosphate kinase/D-beta-D-heptose 1-phosphate adenosyltransferase
MSEVYRSVRAVRDSIPAGKTITLVGGSFDLLHVGHLHLLEYSQKLEELLVVCILSDANVKSHKGLRRPIIGETYRANMVSALRCVDRAYVSDVDTSHQDTLSILQPASVVFGIEDTYHWRDVAAKREQFIRSQFPTIKIHYLERFSDASISTSDIIQKILTSYSN